MFLLTMEVKKNTGGEKLSGRAGFDDLERDRR